MKNPSYKRRIGFEIEGFPFVDLTASTVGVQIIRFAAGRFVFLRINKYKSGGKYGDLYFNTSR